MPYFALSSCLCHATATLEQDWHCHCQACVLLPRAEPEPDHFFVSRIQLFFELARLSLTLKNESMANDCLSDLKKIETKVSDWVVATGWGVAQRTQRPQGLKKRNVLVEKAPILSTCHLQECTGHVRWSEPVSFLSPLSLALALVATTVQGRAV